MGEYGEQSLYAPAFASSLKQASIMMKMTVQLVVLAMAMMMVRCQPTPAEFELSEEDVSSMTKAYDSGARSETMLNLLQASDIPTEKNDQQAKFMAASLGNYVNHPMMKNAPKVAAALPSLATALVGLVDPLSEIAQGALGDASKVVEDNPTPTPAPLYSGLNPYAAYYGNPFMMSYSFPNRYVVAPSGMYYI